MSNQQKWSGAVSLKFAPIDSKTRLIRRLSRAPLKVQRPFSMERGMCEAVLLHTAGGLVGGDNLDVYAELASRSLVRLTTAAAAKVYRTDNLHSVQNLKFTIHSGSRLEWLPQPSILFRGSQHFQALQVELGPSASFWGWDIVSLGRSARGESFTQGELRSQMTINQGAKCLWLERLWLPGTETVWKSPTCLDKQPVVATMVCVETEEKSLGTLTRSVDLVRNSWFEYEFQGQGVVTLSATGGLICRYRGSSTAEARQWFIVIWGLLRQALGQEPAKIPRVWQ